MLVKRLEDHAFAADPGLLSTSQVRAIEVLLRKTLPDLSSVEMAGQGGGPLDILVKLRPHGEPDAGA